MHAIFLQNRRFILCYHKDWFHICNSNVALTHPHLFLCRPNAFSQQSLLCIIPGGLLPLWVFCKLAFFSLVLSASFFLCTVSLLAPSLPWKWAYCIPQLVLIPECPVPSFPPCTVLIAQGWCLANHIKWYIISHPSFPQVLFLIFLHDLCDLGCKHPE